MTISAKVEYTQKLSSTYYKTVLRLLSYLPKPRPLQFINIILPMFDELPMTIAGVGDDSLTILYKVRGEGTRRLATYNGYLAIKGPLGKGIDVFPREKILFVAGGSGVAGYLYLANYAGSLGSTVDLVWGVKSGSEVFELASPSGPTIYLATEDCSKGFCGTALELTHNLLERGQRKYDKVVVVGPAEMLKKACRELPESVEKYVALETMVKCGIGICGSCVVKPYPFLLCRHGPVFNCREIEKWWNQW
mgnify:CR=1 FL=1